MKTKNNGVQLSNWIAIASLVISVVTLVWIGGFRFSALIHDVKGVKEQVQKLEDTMEDRFEEIDARFEKVDERFDKLEAEFHKLDIRMTTVEQRNP